MATKSKKKAVARRRWMLMVVLWLLVGAAMASTEPATTSRDKRISEHETDAKTTAEVIDNSKNLAVDREQKAQESKNKSQGSIASTVSATSPETTGSAGATGGSRRNGATPFKTKAALQTAVNAWCTCADGKNEADALTGCGEIGTWDVSQITDMSSLVEGKATCNPPIGSWTVGQVTTMARMFLGASAFDRPLNNWDVSQVTDMHAMFQKASAFNQPLDRWQVGQVKYMQYMFYMGKTFSLSASAFDQNLNCWDVSSVTNMFWMFTGASNFNQPLCWNTSGKNTDNWLTDTGGRPTSHDPATPCPTCGCTNPSASNFDSTATQDNGSCLLIVPNNEKLTSESSFVTTRQHYIHLGIIDQSRSS